MSILLFLIDIKTAKADGPIYIRADGSVDPPTGIIRRDGDVYTLTQDTSSNTSGIIVQRNNILLNGSHHYLTGTYATNCYGLLLSSVSNVTIKNLIVDHFYIAMLLISSSNNTIADNIFTNNLEGIYLSYYSCNNTILRNSVSETFGDGVLLEQSFDNTIASNSFENNGASVSLFSSNNNSISHNTVVDSIFYGIWLGDSYYNIIVNNNVVAAGDFGFRGDNAHNNTICDNNATNNGVGMWLNLCSNNKIFHNNFVNNANQTQIFQLSTNEWDHGYPSGGNYWSNYNGTDIYHGQYQNLTGGDGIGDMPYDIAGDLSDKYPLMNVSIPLFGDVNGDDFVNAKDAVLLGMAFETNPSDPNWNPYADLNGDGFVNAKDAVILGTYFDKHREY
ncbi:right-handed parallel beta-helix repeat-containing protein [Candidatus Bathyarchaeota archaeon]|nr:right-handed parallel beta-helix repeat-containing protein [Candidatus Bathyarchaeota archaeon]